MNYLKFVKKYDDKVKKLNPKKKINPSKKSSIRKASTHHKSGHVIYTPGGE